ncbi:MAG: D-Ala-D-Ala carboxypeptidase family metallohydrolase [Pseudomonadota bacterium]
MSVVEPKGCDERKAAWSGAKRGIALIGCAALGLSAIAVPAVPTTASDDPNAYYFRHMNKTKPPKRVRRARTHRPGFTTRTRHLRHNRATRDFSKPNFGVKRRRVMTAMVPPLKFSAKQRKKALAKIHFAPHAPSRCLPKGLKNVLIGVALKFGSVRVNSTHRSWARNKRVGGRPRSFHLKCRAVDFLVRAHRYKVLRYLLSRPEVGGYKVYRRSGHIHIDDGPRRTW